MKRLETSYLPFLSTISSYLTHQIYNGCDVGVLFIAGVSMSNTVNTQSYPVSHVLLAIFRQIHFYVITLIHSFLMLFETLRVVQVRLYLYSQNGYIKSSICGVRLMI